jgi:hypothetical protein
MFSSVRLKKARPSRTAPAGPKGKIVGRSRCRPEGPGLQPPTTEGNVLAKSGAQRSPQTFEKRTRRWRTALIAASLAKALTSAAAIVSLWPFPRASPKGCRGSEAAAPARSRHDPIRQPSRVPRHRTGWKQTSTKATDASKAVERPIRFRSRLFHRRDQARSGCRWPVRRLPTMIYANRLQGCALRRSSACLTTDVGLLAHGLIQSTIGRRSSETSRASIIVHSASLASGLR